MSDIDTIDQRFGDIVAGLNTGDRRLFAELVHLTDHPELWVQVVWASTATDQIEAGELPPEHQPTVCGTVGCLAGNLVVSAGIVGWDHRGELLINWTRVDKLGLGHDMFGMFGWIDWSGVAATLIGYPTEDPYDSNGPAGLFNGNNTLAELWRTAEVITSGRVRLPDELADRVAEIDRVREEWAQGRR